MSLWRNIEDATGGLANRVLGRSSAAEKREQANMANEQIKAYKDQTELAAKQLEETRAQKDVEKRRINEKQIRSLRNNYRPSGGLLNSQSAQTELGTSSNLPNKLGA